MNRMARHGAVLLGLAACILAKPMRAADKDDVPLIPTIMGQWWTIAHNPDLGQLTGPKQQPVDFGIWQAADGAWQLWSCIRRTKEPGVTRLFHRWESQRLTDSNWNPMGIAMQADPQYGERPGGLQAPFVFRSDDRYHMFYGDWDHICRAESKDGKHFTRQLGPGGKSSTFGEGEQDNSRDPMVWRTGDRWLCYYTAHPNQKGSVYCRTSTDMIHWSDAQLVAAGGESGMGPYSSECPFVVELNPSQFYLFRTQHYTPTPVTRVYYSTNPLAFGVDEDEEYLQCELSVAAPEIIRLGDEYYIAALLPTLEGIRMARLDWVAKLNPAK